jgi:transcriptional regulator with XRE-family HTH domain
MQIVGSNIRRLRKEQNYNIRDFGRKVGVSASFISQVEMGKISPSLSKLRDIADSLNTTVGLLIGETESTNNHSPVVKKTNRRHTDHLGSGINVELLSTPDPFKQMEPILIELEPGASSGDNQYQHYGQEFVIVLKGKIKISLNKTDYMLNEGDSIYFNSNIPHSFANLSKGVSKALWVVTPPSF